MGRGLAIMAGAWMLAASALAIGGDWDPKDPAPWHVRKISRLNYAQPGVRASEATDPRGLKYLHIQVEFRPDFSDRRLHGFRVTDQRGQTVAELYGFHSGRSMVVFEGDWTSLQGLYLDAIGHREPLWSGPAEPRSPPNETAPSPRMQPRPDRAEAGGPWEIDPGSHIGERAAQAQHRAGAKPAERLAVPGMGKGTGRNNGDAERGSGAQGKGPGKGDGSRSAGGIAGKGTSGADGNTGAGGAGKGEDGAGSSGAGAGSGAGKGASGSGSGGGGGAGGAGSGTGSGGEGASGSVGGGGGGAGGGGLAVGMAARGSGLAAGGGGLAKPRLWEEEVARPRKRMVLFLSCEEEFGRGRVYQVDEDGLMLGTVFLPYAATGLALHRQPALVAAVPRELGKVYQIDDAGKVSVLLENDRLAVQPVDVGIAGNSDTMVLADNLGHVLSTAPVKGGKAALYRRFDLQKWDRPLMSVAVTLDHHVLLGTNMEPGIYRFAGDDSAGAPLLLPRAGGVAADTASPKWAAAQPPDQVLVYEGETLVKTLRLPAGKAFWRHGLLSFGPDESIVVAARPANDPKGEVWLLKLETKDDSVRRLFPWKREPIADFVVGPRMFWNRPEKHR